MLLDGEGDDGFEHSRFPLCPRRSPASRSGTEGRPAKAPKPAQAQAGPKEIGGRKGPDPTRYGDWEKKGRCIDF
ncbi:MAG: DUF1674 domain-containing protein [Proteobacteria bacterium]|nr:DUF1674 domain-containing protein [Pseudomonadota bacterium]